jgi:hypothetical protein
MTVLVPPRHPTVDRALTLARRWCRGHQIDAAPALAHAARVAVTVSRHIPHVPPEPVAAALLHDSPEYAPQAEPGIDLYPYLTQHLGPEVARIVAALEVEHAALGSLDGPPVPVDDPPVLAVSAADKIVALGSMLRRAAASGDPAGFWRARGAFTAVTPYLHAFHVEATPHLPETMAGELARLVEAVTVAQGLSTV